MPDLPTLRPRVLVADPNPETTALLARQCEWAGYDTFTAGNGDEALELLQRMHPDAVVIDAKMEGTTGYEVVRRLREQPSSRWTAVLMISARAGKLDRDFAFTVGVDDYVRKPFRCSDIVARLALLVPSGDAPRPAQPMARRRSRRLAAVPKPALAAR